MAELMKQYEEKTGNVMPEQHYKNMHLLVDWYQSFSEWLARELKAEQVVVKMQKAVIEELKTQLTWRPVSDRPENNDYYLCKMCGDVEAVCKYKYGQWYDFEGPERDWVESDRVTHWLPIPPAPEGEVK